MEDGIRRHDVKHEEHAMKTMWRIAYGDKHEENALPFMWRIAYGDMILRMRRMHRKPYGE